jgi:CRP-like cAMP-binding protein
MAETEGSARLLREIFLAGFMSGLPPENVQWATSRLARGMEDVYLKAGEVLYRQGEPTNEHYFVTSGEIELVAEGVPAWRLGERSLVGTIDLTLERPRTRTAIATKKSHLLRMPASDWLDMLEDNFELMLRGVVGLAEGVHALRMELADFDPEIDHRPSTSPGPVPRGRLGLIDRIFKLRGVALFAEGEVQALTNLAELAHDVEVTDAALIFEREKPSDAMFVVLSGEVVASREGSSRPERYGPGCLVLGSVAATAADLGYEARAAGLTRMLKISREDYYDVMEEHFALARSSLKALATERELLVNEKGRRAQLLRPVA